MLCKKIILLIALSILQSMRVLSEEELFFEVYDQDFNLFPLCSDFKDPLAVKPIKQLPPVYPRRALEAGASGTVLLELNINIDGTVKNSKVVWSSSDISRFDNAFDKRSITASKEFIFEPELNEFGARIESTTHTVIIFTVEGMEEVFNLGNQTRRFKSLRRLMQRDPLSFLVEIDRELSQTDLSNTQRAIYLYFKGLILFRQGESNVTVLEKLEKSQELYFQIYTHKTQNFNETPIYMLGNNEAKLHTYVGLLLGQLYLQQSKWNESAVQNATVLRMALNQKIRSPRLLQAYINLGISAYNLGLWCQADQSWDSAIALAKKYNKTLPEWLNEYKEKAYKRRDLTFTE